MCPVLIKCNMRNVDKEKHVNRVSADVALIYEHDVNYVDVTCGSAQVTCFSLSTSHTVCLSTSRHIVPNSVLVLIQSWPRCAITPLTFLIIVELTIYFSYVVELTIKFSFYLPDQFIFPYCDDYYLFLY